MADQSKIRWRESDRNNLNKEVRRFNSKLDRLAKANPDIAEFLPERKSVRAIRGAVESRIDLSREIRAMNSLFKKGATQLVTSEQGVVTTKYQLHQLKLQVNRINTNRAREKLMANPTPEKGTLATIKNNNLNAKKFDFNKIRPGREWDMFVESVEKQAKGTYLTNKMNEYKKNYLRTVKENLGQKGKKLYNLVKSLDAKTLYEHFYDDPVLQIQFITDPLPSGDIADAAVSKWEAIIEELETTGGNG
jgi:hypothetical protein